MKYYKPSNTNCVVNVSNTILEHFGVEPFHDIIPELKERLKGHKKVVLLLFDGMGKSMIEQHLPKNAFLRKHIIKEIDSTFPPTTVASTTSLLSGRFPIEHGWLGWNGYFQNEDVILAYFSNNVEYRNDHLIYEGPLLSRKYFDYKNILDLIKEKNPSLFVSSYFPAWNEINGCATLDTFFTSIEYSLDNHDEVFIYGYWDDPDHTIHLEGTKSLSVRSRILLINQYVEMYSKEHPDTCFVVMADHSLVDVEYLFWDDHPDLKELLKRPTSVDARAMSMFVKEGQQEKFIQLFKQYYGDYFDIYTHQEVIDNHIFGKGNMHENVESCIGDYLAIATTNRVLIWDKELWKDDYGTYRYMIGYHAGGLKEESIIHLICIN